MLKLFRMLYRLVCALINTPPRGEYSGPTIDKIINDSGLQLWEFNKIFFRLYLNGTNRPIYGGSYEIAVVAANDIAATFRLCDMGKVAFVLDELCDHMLKYRKECNLVDVYYYLYQYTKVKKWELF